MYVGKLLLFIAACPHATYHVPMYRNARDTSDAYMHVIRHNRLSGVCRRMKNSTYDLDMIVRCVESGGVTDTTRGEDTVVLLL